MLITKHGRFCAKCLSQYYEHFSKTRLFGTGNIQNWVDHYTIISSLNLDSSGGVVDDTLDYQPKYVKPRFKIRINAKVSRFVFRKPLFSPSM